MIGLTIMLAAPVGAAADTGAPDPGGNESAALSLPKPGKQFGFNGLFNANQLDSGVEAGLIARAGGRVARMPLTWRGVEPQRDVWDEAVWARHALNYTAFRAQGVTPHFVLNSSPIWARDAGEPQACTDVTRCQYPPARSMLNEWEEFVAEVARRFPAATIEVWNEPNSEGQWRSGVDPERYAELLAAADRAAAGVDPDVPVLMAGLGSSTGPGWMAMRKFLDRAYGASPSLKGHTDALNLHVYPGGRLGAGTFFARAFADVREMRAAHGDGGTPIFVSETGASTSGPEAVGEAEQADIVVRTVTKILGMSDVSGVLVNALTDRSELALEDRERGFGVLRDALLPPLEPKRAYCQLTRAAGSLYSLCPPLAIVQAGPEGPTNQASPEFRFTATEAGATFECSLDGAAFAACVSPKRYQSLPEGSHRFEVRAVGALGRRDPEPIGREFALDVTPPETGLTGSVSGPTSDTTPTFHPSTSDASSRTECSLNGAAWEPCASPDQLGPLADGAYALRARAVDPAGNADPTPASISFRVDTRAPAVTITAGPAGRTANAQPRFEFTADEGGVTFLCGFNSQAPGPCREPNAHTTLGALADGSYSFQVLAIDAARNRGATVSRTFQVDRTGPATSIIPPSSPTNDPTPTFQLKGSEPGATFECRFDSAAFAPCPSSATSATLADGSHSIEARGRDDLGNRGPATWLSFVVDTRVPETSFTASIPARLEVTELVLQFRADEGGARLQCSTDGAAFRDCISPLTLTGLLDGPHTFRVRAIDRAGNVDRTPATKLFTVDTGAAPQTSLDAVKRISKRHTRFRFSADDPSAHFECSMDRRAFRDCVSIHRAGRLKRGRHMFEVRAVDAVGHTDGTPARARFRVR